MLKYPIHKLQYGIDLELNDYKEVKLIYQTLSRRELINLTNIYYNDNTNQSIFKYQVVLTSLVGKSKSYIEFLPDQVIEDLFNKIIEISTFDNSIISKLKKSFNISMAEELQSKTWNCETCKASGFLQKARNCGYLEDCKDCDKTFFMIVDGDEFTQCPKSVIDNELLNIGFECYYMYNKGLLPEEGGIYDQTDFFFQVSVAMYDWITAREKQNNPMMNMVGSLFGM